MVQATKTSTSQIYFVQFESNDELKKFASNPPEGTRVRCVFQKKNAISVEANQKGFLKIISEGFLPNDNLIEEEKEDK